MFSSNKTFKYPPGLQLQAMNENYKGEPFERLPKGGILLPPGLFLTNPLVSHEEA